MGEQTEKKESEKGTKGMGLSLFRAGSQELCGDNRRRFEGIQNVTWESPISKRKDEKRLVSIQTTIPANLKLWFFAFLHFSNSVSIRRGKRAMSYGRRGERTQHKVHKGNV